tara:strand:- start:252 stop:650 length:399 start_codon:yes stop_codon:yes gene_type:complete
MKFQEMLNASIFDDEQVSARTTRGKCIKLINSKLFRHDLQSKGFSDDDIELLKRIRRLFNDLRVIDASCKEIWRSVEKHIKEVGNVDNLDAVKVLYIFADKISPKLIRSAFVDDETSILAKKEVILSLNLNE